MSETHDPNGTGDAAPVDPFSQPTSQDDAATPYGQSPQSAPQYGQGQSEQPEQAAPQFEQPQQAQYEQGQYAQQYDPAQQAQAQYAQQYDPAQYAQPEQAQYDQQGYAGQYAAPEQTAVAGFAPLAPTGATPGGSASGSSARNLLILTAGLLPVIGAVLAYVLARWVDSQWAVLGGVGVVVAALTVAAAVAPKHNVVAAFLAAAVATPFLLYTSYAAGMHAHVEDAFSDYASGSDDEDDDDNARPNLPSPGSDDEDQTPEPDVDEPTVETVALGSTGTVLAFEVTVTSAKCGLDKVENGADNPDSWEDGEPEFLTAKAPSGKEFCLIESTWKNASKEPVDGFSVPEFSKVTVEDGTSYAQSELDREVTRYRSRSLGFGYDTVNPGDKVTIATAFTVPAGAKGAKVNTEGWDFGGTDERYSVDFAIK